jgi:hypothetical protein
MPKPDEVQAVLDVLFMSKTINWEFEQKMWREAKSKLDYTLKDKLTGRLPFKILAWMGKERVRQGPERAGDISFGTGRKDSEGKGGRRYLSSNRKRCTDSERSVGR